MTSTSAVPRATAASVRVSVTRRLVGLTFKLTRGTLAPVTPGGTARDHRHAPCRWPTCPVGPARSPRRWSWWASAGRCWWSASCGWAAAASPTSCAAPAPRATGSRPGCAALEAAGVIERREYQAVPAPLGVPPHGRRPGPGAGADGPAGLGQRVRRRPRRPRSRAAPSCREGAPMTTDTTPGTWGEPRTRTVTWHDPAPAAARGSRCPAWTTCARWWTACCRRPRSPA